MPYTDQDEADLKQIAADKGRGFPATQAWKRQYGTPDKDAPRGGSAEANSIADRKTAMGHNEGSSVRHPDGSLRQRTR